MGSTAKGEVRNNLYWIPISLEANEKQKIHFVFTHFKINLFDNNLLAASKMKSPEEVAKYAFKNWDALKNSTQKLSDTIPSTGDVSLDEYVRLSLTGAVIKTKVLKDGTVTTYSTKK